MERHSFCLAVAISWILASGLPVAADPSVQIRGKARAMDGDSVRIGRQEIRLWGIDAPEFDQPCERDGRSWDCGRAARSALASRIDGRTIECVVRDHDAYGRAVSVCRVGGGRATLNEWLVRQGWAVDYRRYSKGAHAAAQRDARTAGRGIWSGRFELPERWRRTHPHPRHR